MTPADDSGPLPQAKILLVDDRPANLLALEAILQHPGQESIRAASGEEALRLLLQGDFALVLLDVQMPGMDGYEAARLIRGRDRSRRVPIIFVTAHGSTDARVAQAYALGAVDFIVKPVVPAILRAKVEVFVELFRNAQEIRRQAERLRRAERREFERRVRQEEERFRLVAENVKDYAIFMLDTAGAVVTWNRGAERLLGYGAGEAVGSHFARFFTPEDVAAGRPARELREAGEAGRATDDNWLVRKDGGRFWANGVSTALRDEGGELRGFVKIVRDLTDHKRWEEALQRRAEELAEANASKDRFLAMLSHELRNPLAPLSNALTVLHLRGADPPTVAWACDVAGRQVAQLTHLVDDLLDVSRIHSGKVRLRPERLDLGQLVRRTAEDHRRLIEGAGLGLELDVPAEPAWVRGDATRLAQVTSNLLVNSAKFTDRGGRVAVRLAADGGAGLAEVAVRDTGVGIGADLLPRVWEAFAQADQGLDRSRGGLGLGLALVKGLVELHGGTVQAASAGPGAGAEFTFRLPLAPGGACPAPTPAGPAAAPGPLRVLIVEDNRDAAETLRVLLEMCGHQVAVAHTGLAGLEAARAVGPDVILCDLGLPDFDGYAVARALREGPAPAKGLLIAVSGYGQDSDVRRSREAGFDLHLTKPVGPESLRRVLAGLAPR